MTSASTTNPPKNGALTPAMAVEFYRLMYTSRKLDDAEIFLKKQNQAFFQISAAGHEAIGVALAKCAQVGKDWFYTYYRDQPIALALGMSPREILLQAVGAASDPSSGGRQMPGHYCRRDLNIVTPSSPTGSQYLNAVGNADVRSYLVKMSAFIKDIAFSKDEVTFVTTGEGATSQGDFWEAINAISLNKLPIVFVVEDNGYAISVPVEYQTAGGNIVKLFEHFPFFKGFYANGNNVADAFRVFSAAVAHVRSGAGAALVHATCTRPYSHSLSDDHIFYRTQKEIAAESDNDCLKVTAAHFIQQKLMSPEDIEALQGRVDAEVREAVDEVLRAPKPHPDTALLHLYSPHCDPCDAKIFASEPAFDGPDNLPMGQLINRCLVDEMQSNPKIVVFGEDVADVSREENLEECKGKGGVFKLTQGLQRRFGSHRCFNSPLAESMIVGRAIGMAVRGLKPCVEIQFFDYIWTAMNQMRNEMCIIRYRSNNMYACPMVIRVPIGGYIGGGSIYHSQTGENIFVHTPGLRVVYPSNALDANGLLRTALRCDDPVLFLEHKQLYYQGYNRSAYPGNNFMIPFGKAQIVRPGTDATIVCWGHLVYRSLEVAKHFAKEGKEIEVIDLRTLSPVDIDTVLASVRKTSRVLVAHEEHEFGGFGGEIAAQIADKAFDYLDAPVKRLGSKHCWVAYSPVLEQVQLPQTADLINAVSALLRY